MEMVEKAGWVDADGPRDINLGISDTNAMHLSVSLLCDSLC